jgi:hypothetical protein
MSNAHEPAFPTQMWDIEDKEATWLDGGLSKREYFAGLAMQGLASNSWLMQTNIAAKEAGLKPPALSELACGMADVLLAELEKN